MDCKQVAQEVGLPSLTRAAGILPAKLQIKHQAGRLVAAQARCLCYGVLTSTAGKPSFLGASTPQCISRVVLRFANMSGIDNAIAAAAAATMIFVQLQLGVPP